MTVTTRTNLATNPSVAAAATNWAAVAGTGGTAVGARNTGEGYSGTGFFRVTWSAATTALSGGFTYSQTGLAASTLYQQAFWVRSSKTQTVALTVTYRDAALATVNTIVGPSVALTANVWTLVTASGTSGAAVTNAVCTVAATTGGALWANTDTFDGDAALIEASSVAGPYFDGSFVNAASIMYAWTGAADASTSTATTYVPQLSLVTKSDDPCDRVEVTITDLTPTENTVTVWRTSDGKRQAVRESRGRTKVTSDFIVDYEVPLGRTVTYELEVTAGLNNQVAVTPQNVVVAATSGWIQDPLDPGSAIRIHGGVGPGG
ncbi:MAG: hypothetical protein ACRDTJ_14860, partial [Pseudonocardiaceae bacterium]